jgi:hypothetical protein
MQPIKNIWQNQERGIFNQENLPSNHSPCHGMTPLQLLHEGRPLRFPSQCPPVENDEAREFQQLFCLEKEFSPNLWPKNAIIGIYQIFAQKKCSQL